MRYLLFGAILLIAQGSFANSEIDEVASDFYISLIDEDTTIDEGKAILKLNLNQAYASIVYRVKTDDGWSNGQYLPISDQGMIIDTMAAGEYSFEMSVAGFETVFRVVALESQHFVEANVNFREKKVLMVTPAKPAVYVYSDEEKIFNIKIDPIGQFGFTFPAHGKNGWDIRVNKDGLSCNGKSYDYLFWDSKQEGLDFNYNFGFVFQGSETADFLESKLKEMGLNDKENQDFIAYWGPKLSSNKYNFVHFILNDACANAIGSLESSIEPESALRVFMVYKPMEGMVPVVEQDFKPFKRKGLTIVEWGGCEVFNEQVGL